MKTYLTFTAIFIFSSLTVFAQNKNTIEYDYLMTIEGSEYVVASANSRGKMAEFIDCQLLFINTSTQQTRTVDFSGKGYLENPRQIKIDMLGINKVIVGVRVPKNDKIGYWNTQNRIFILSLDGSEKRQLTDNSFFTQTWVVNQQTGAIVITGYYDANGNSKHDKDDKNQILVYDLKTLQLLSKI